MNVNDVRERAVTLVCAFAALASGVFAALGSEQWIATAGVTLFFLVAAMIVPHPLVALAIAALIPLQFYFPLAGALYTRGALVFVAVAALRVFVVRVAVHDGRSAVAHQRQPENAVQSWQRAKAVVREGRLRSLPWMIPATFFVLAALVAAITAPNRYLALKGIYDWLPIFATAFVVGEVVESERLLKQIVVVLIVLGVGEALLGLAQSALDVKSVVAALQMPVSELVYQPNLLRDRLLDLSFNWILFDRVLPFGTFINGIDYAICLAAILSLVLAVLLGAGNADLSHLHLRAVQVLRGRFAKQSPSRILETASSHPFDCAQGKPSLRSGSLLAVTIGLCVCAAIIGVALLQTFKGSGMIALTGGIAALVLLYIPRLSSRTLAIGGFILVSAILLALPFYDAIGQRVIFLIQRETGVLAATGRTAIWAHLLPYLTQRPWFGFGLNNTSLLVEPLPSWTGGTFVYVTATAESAYVATLVETGMVGFLALAGFIVVVLARAYRNVQPSSVPELRIGILTAIVAVLCGSLTVVGLTTDQNGMLLGVLIGMTFARIERGQTPP